MNLLKKSIKDENGLVIIEATIVFPIMFFMLIFIVYIGNLYFQMAQIDNIVMDKSIYATECVVDPLHEDIAGNGIIPLDVDVKPYRYILGELPNCSTDKFEVDLEKQLGEAFDKKLTTIFKAMKPKIKNIDAEFQNYVIYQKFKVDVSYEITFPIKFIFNKDFTTIKLSSHSEFSVNDTTEFVRNTDMILDLMEGTKLGNEISSVFDKVVSLIDKIGGKGKE